MNQKKCYFKGIVGRYSLLNELGYRAKALFHQDMIGRKEWIFIEK